MTTAVVSLLPAARGYASRKKRTFTDAVESRLLRRGYATPAQRGQALENDLLLLDSMEAGLAKASMRGEGYVRIAACLRLEGPTIEREALEVCLSALQARHPYLRRSIARTPLGLALPALEGPLPIVEHEASGAQSIEALWKGIEARSLRPGDALVRVHLIRFPEDRSRTALIVEGEHIISDGASLIALSCELVEQLSLYATNGAPRSLTPLQLSASVNARCAAEVGGSRNALRRIAQRMLETVPRLLKHPPTTLPRDTSQGIRQCHTHVARATLSRDETEQLYRAAKAEGASLSTALGAAMSLGIGAQVYPASEVQGKPEDRSFRISYSVSLRHRYSKPVRNDELGAHVSGVDPTVRLSSNAWAGSEPSKLWDAARQLKRDLDASMRPGVDAHWLMNFASGHAMALPPRLPQVNLFCSLVLTDCGRFVVPSRIGAYTLEELRPLVNGRGFSYPYLGVTPTPEGGLMLSLFAPAPALNAEDVDAVLADAAARLRAVLRGPKTETRAEAVSTEAA